MTGNNQMFYVSNTTNTTMNKFPLNVSVDREVKPLPKTDKVRVTSGEWG